MRRKLGIKAIVVAVLMAPTALATVTPPALAVNGCLQPHLDGRRVHNLQDLECLRTNAAAYLGETIYQTADIELNEWDTPIEEWYGTFNGGGNEITGDSTAPLFTLPDGPITIAHTHRTGNVVTTNSYVGGFIGNTNFPVTISASSMTGDVTGIDSVGGFVGLAGAGISVSGSTMRGDVEGTGGKIGGLLGDAYGVAVVITESSSNGDVSGANDVGGLLGYGSTTSITITRASKTGNVSAETYNAGGFIGKAETVFGTTITKSYSTSNVSGGTSAGGLVGSSLTPNVDGEPTGFVTINASYSTGNITSLGVGENFFPLSAGGLIGDAFANVSISESYATGDVTSSAWLAGGLVGNVFRITISNSFTTGDVSGISFVGALVGNVGREEENEFDVANSYTSGNVTGTGYTAGFVGEGPADSMISASFCLESAGFCGAGDGESSDVAPLFVPGVPLPADDLKSPSYMTSQGWDFDQVWCVRDALNDGFPVLRAIDFGPGDTNNCREPAPIWRAPIVSIWQASLDPNGGTCVDGVTRNEPWNSAFAGYRYLPGPSDCTKPGYTLAGWADRTTPSTVKTLPLLIDPASNTRRYFVAENLDLVAVWTRSTSDPTTSAITDLIVFANFLCGPCTTAWLIYTSPPDTTNVTTTIDDTAVTCNQSGVVFGLSVCELTNLTPGPHTVVVTPVFIGPTDGASTATIFTLRD